MFESPVASDPSRAVMVDVGPGYGALVVMAPPDLLGEEIEISSVAAPGLRQHVYVLPRSLPRDRAFAAVFPRLRAGSHLLWSPDGSPVLTVAVREGSVEEVIWPSRHAIPVPADSPPTASTPTKGD